MLYKNKPVKPSKKGKRLLVYSEKFGKAIALPKLALVEKKIIKEYFSGKGAVELGKKYKVNRKTILNLMYRNKIKTRGQAETNKKYKINDDYFKVLDSEDKLYFFGLIFADGCLSEGRKGSELKIELQERDKHILNTLRKHLGTDKPLQYLKPRKTYFKKGGRVIHCRASYAFRFHGKNLSHLLRHGISKRKSHTAIFPSSIKTIEDLKHFTRGFFDGDGCFYHSKKDLNRYNVSFVGTHQFIKSLKRRFDKHLGIRSIISYKGSIDVISHLEIYRKLDVVHFLEWLYEGDDPALRLKRKYNKYKKWLKRIKERLCQPISQRDRNLKPLNP